VSVPRVHRKQRADAPAGFFACEAAGLRWLAASDGARVVEVLDVGEHHLDLVRLDPVARTRSAPPSRARTTPARGRSAPRPTAGRAARGSARSTRRSR
jgi:hypothetical protein